jgi:hypothetical protein
MANRQKIRARYAVKGPTKQKVTFTKASMNKETKSMELEEVTEERDCYMVLFPQGHSIRVTSYDLLKQMGYHLKPRMVDMETGDIVEIGGDPYDFANDEITNDDIILDEDEPSMKRKKPLTQDAHA